MQHERIFAKQNTNVMEKDKFIEAQTLTKEIEAKKIVLGLFRESLKFSDVDLRANGTQLLRVSPEVIRDPTFYPHDNGREVERQIKESNAEVFEKIRAVITWKVSSLETDISELEHKFLML